jgi:hypothetical protein
VIAVDGHETPEVQILGVGEEQPKLGCVDVVVESGGEQIGIGYKNELIYQCPTIHATNSELHR